MRIIGLTGQVAAGKDSVAKILSRTGAYIINVDEVAHSLYEPQTEVWRELVKAFGSKILKREGVINRKKLAGIVFLDKGQLQQLNKIIHPVLKEAIIKKVESFKLLDVRCKLLVVNAAVLKEIGLLASVDEVWVVIASKEKRLNRLLKIGFSRVEALARINSQAPQKDYLEMADSVIRNDGLIIDLKKQVLALLYPN